MDEQVIYSLLKENLCVQDEALRKLIWTLYRNSHFSSNFKQNILLIGERGTGKTTMVREVADLMDIPIGEIYDMFLPGGFNVSLFMNGIYQIMSKGDEASHGILLIHDFQNSFLYGSSTGFNAMLASNTINLGESKYFDVSNITFIGEMDTNQMKDIFPKERDILADLENNYFMSPTLNLVKEYLDDTNTIRVDEHGNKTIDLRFEKNIANQIRTRFLSTNCKEAFGQKVYMENMGISEILKALNSPFSVLNLYRDDLDDDYINSDEFVKKVVYQVLESGEGLHSLSEAIEEVALHDYKRDEKILKKGSLLISHCN